MYEFHFFVNNELIDSCIVQNNLKTKSLGGFMLALSEWFCEAIRQSVPVEENKNNANENMDYLINGLVMFRIIAHKIISEHSTDAALMEQHFNSLPTGLENVLGK